MAETVLVNAATVGAGSSCAVVAHEITTPPQVDFRIVCDQAYTVRFYVDDATFSSISGVGELIGTEDSHAATTGLVYSVDAGDYDFIAAVVTNEGAVPATVTVVVGDDLVAEAPTALFTVAEARLYGPNGPSGAKPLASATDYPDATILAEEERIRRLFTIACGRDFIPTQHANELHDGDGSIGLPLDWPLITAVTAAATRSGKTWTALTADELLYITIGPWNELIWDPYVWPSGRANIRVTYTAGYASVPSLIKDAALQMAISELPPSQMPRQADSMEGAGQSFSWARGDGFGGTWSQLPDVMRALRLYGADGESIGLG